MREVLGILCGVEADLSLRKGEFELFGLFRRRKAVHWNVVVSAPWVDAELRPTIEFILDELKRAAGMPALLMTRVNVVPDPRFVEAVRSIVTVEHGMETIGPGDYGNVEIARGYVITSRPLPATVTPTAAA